MAMCAVIVVGQLVPPLEALVTSSTPNHYTLVENGRAFSVATASAGLSTIGRLFVDGVQVDEQKSKDNAIHLNGGGLTVVVRLNWLDHVTQILAVPSGVDPKKVDEEGVAFAPPPGSHAARLERLRRDHPTLYAARHVAVAILQVLVGVLGIGALLRGLLPRIDWPEIPWPDLPPIPRPVLPAIPWPDIPLPDVDLPNFTIPGWIGEVWSSVNWLVPIAIAVVVAFNEVQKRRQRERVAAERRKAETLG
jgi:hypothetical protein